MDSSWKTTHSGSGCSPKQSVWDMLFNPNGVVPSLFSGRPAQSHINAMNGPEPLNLSVHVHDQESVAPDSVLQAFREPSDVLVGIDDDELHLVEGKGEVMWNPPLSLVGVID